MLFNSIHFLIFFPIVVGLYFLIPQKYRWFLLLASSYYFYMSWNPKYIVLIMLSTLVDYFSGLQIHKAKKKARKKAFLWLSIIVNLGLLFTFKYFNFFSESIIAFLKSISIQMNPITVKVLLPVGISFYTFQTLSYTIDVYRGKIKPEKHLGIFAVYVSFFPQLVAGPIERAKNLLPQFYKKNEFDFKRVTDGLKLMLWGFFKKIAVADLLAVSVNAVYNDPTSHTGFPLILATVFFAFQIYCDFSGYSDIAIGAAQVMGIRLMDNFKRPYFSRSISEFWNRWHISLYSWFKDYIYIPLGGSRVSVPKWYSNVLIVFLISGLWHGASWTFVFWGLLHGLFIVFGLITKNIREKIVTMMRLGRSIHNLVQVAITFILVNIGWIFFRANSFQDAKYILTHLFSGLNFSYFNIGIDNGIIVLSILLIGFMEFVHLIQEHVRIREFLDDKPIFIRWPVYVCLIALILFVLALGVFKQTQFIYFQF